MEVAHLRLLRRLVDHMRQSGFEVAVDNLDDIQSLKKTRALPPEMQSCHTAEVEEYVLEGHVPAQAVNRLLAERPQAKGLAVVPGLPQGSVLVRVRPGAPIFQALREY